MPTMPATVLATQAHSGLGIAAHGIHYAILGVGIIGLVALLAPRSHATSQPPRDEHEARVQALRSTLAPPGTAASGPIRSARTSALAPALALAQRALLPLALVSSAAAAGVHAAVGPAHFREGTLIGLFFATSALLQLLWAGAIATHCTRPLLTAAAVGNVAVVGLWVVTRTAGLPFGLLPTPEAVGPWDLACAAWELVVAATCVTLLRSADPVPPRVVEWRRWDPAVHWFVGVSVVVLVALSLSGASA